MYHSGSIRDTETTLVNWIERKKSKGFLTRYKVINWVTKGVKRELWSSGGLLSVYNQLFGWGNLIDQSSPKNCPSQLQSLSPPPSPPSSLFLFMLLFFYVAVTNTEILSEGKEHSMWSLVLSIPKPGNGLRVCYCVVSRWESERSSSLRERVHLTRSKAQKVSGFKSFLTTSTLPMDNTK